MIVVVGGTYGERCLTPASDSLVGSGVRASALLRAVDSHVMLHTAVADEERSAAQAVWAGLGLSVNATERDQPVRFTYRTPLSPPVIDGFHAAVEEDLQVEGEAVLAFGMLETEPRVSGRRVVFDPQRPRDATPIPLGNVVAEHLAIIANARETRVLGGDDDPARAALALRATHGADTVVTKLGAAGALVTSEDGQLAVGPHVTARVWPIGTGDAFAAGFAWAWAVGELPPLDAAAVGSAVAAAWASTQSFATSPATFAPIAATDPGRSGTVYLAAPFFDLGQHWVVDLVADSIVAVGGKVFSPLHHVGPGGDEVAQKDLQGLEGSNAVLALLDGFDSGTVFEVGWARRQGLPVVGYLANPDDCQAKMLRGSGVELTEDLSTAVYRAVWAARGLEG